MALFTRRKAETPTFDLGPQEDLVKGLARTFVALPDYQVDSLAQQTLNDERVAVIERGENPDYAVDVRDFAGRTGDALWRARDAARKAGREYSFNQLIRNFEVKPGAYVAASLAARGLFARDLITDDGFTSDDYDTLTGPWRRVVGAIHPDDIEAPVTPIALTRVWDLSLDG